MGSEFDEFTFPVLIAGYSYAVHADPQTLRTIPATLAKSTMFHGLWFIDGEGKARRIKETICSMTDHRPWNPFRLRDVPIQFVFEDDTVVFTVGEVKSLLFDGLARVPDHAGYDLAELKMRLEPAQSLCEIFRILSEKQEAIRSTL
ncbi:MAG: hypothetical protein JNL62_09510 [Bryobacterales bacterium]|nr:hypothetical protein [Bryobacterales bacterium]